MELKKPSTALAVIKPSPSSSKAANALAVSSLPFFEAEESAAKYSLEAFQADEWISEQLNAPPPEKKPWNPIGGKKGFKGKGKGKGFGNNLFGPGLIVKVI